MTVNSDLWIIDHTAAIERETEKACLFRFYNGVSGFHFREYWVPKKLISTIPNPNPCMPDDLAVPLWFARKNGWR